MPVPFSDSLLKMYASNPHADTLYHTISIQHTSLSQAYYFVHNATGFDAKIENNTTQTFLPLPFQIKLPDEDSFGRSNATLQVDNIDASFINFANDVAESDDDATCIYRPVLSGRFDQVELEEPPELVIYELRYTRQVMSCRLDMFDLLNTKLPRVLFSPADGYPVLNG